MIFPFFVHILGVCQQAACIIDANRKNRIRLMEDGIKCVLIIIICTVLRGKEGELVYNDTWSICDVTSYQCDRVLSMSMTLRGEKAVEKQLRQQSKKTAVCWGSGRGRGLGLRYI